MTYENTGEVQTNAVNIKALDQRFHYFDNLRALAMFVGVLFHAAIAYSPYMHNMWFTTSDQNSDVIDIVSLFTHLFRMPLFFVISGFFAILLIQKRGLPGYIKNRMKRIVLPFVVFYPLALIAVVGSIGWAFGNVENLSPIMQFLKSMSNNPDAPRPPLNPMHLWFLVNLFFFIVITVALYKLKFFQSRLLDKLTSVWFIVLVLPLLMVPGLASQFAPHPAPDKFYPQLWSLGFYGLFFMFGCMVFLKQQILTQLDRFKHGFLLVSLIAYGYFYTTLGDPFSLQQVLTIAQGQDFKWSHLPVAIVEAYIAVYMTIYCLLMGKKYLNKSNKVLRLMADSSYWVYIIHVPVLLWVQFAMADIDLNLWLKFIISSAAALIIGIVSYIVMVKKTPIGWLLNGRVGTKSEGPQLFVPLR